MMHRTLDRFEEIILRHLQGWCNDELAGNIMSTYLPVIRELQDDHDGAKVQAEKIYQAYKDGIRPQDWIDHIRKTRQKYKNMLTAPATRLPQDNITITVLYGNANKIRRSAPVGAPHARRKTAPLAVIEVQAAAKSTKPQATRSKKTHSAAASKLEGSSERIRRDSATGRFLAKDASVGSDAQHAGPVKGYRKVKPVQ